MTTRPPRTNDQLWLAIRYHFGVEIPRVAVCDGHSSPFDTFADAYFARYDNIVVKASRGLAGKTFGMATLVAAEAAFLGAPVTLLGGSLEQAGYAHEYEQALWKYKGAPPILASDPTHRRTQLTNEGEIVLLAASTKSARGSHRPRLRLDEVDEMDWKVLEAALGTPMEQTDAAGAPITPQVLMGSTHHNPQGTFTRVLEELAVENDWEVREWCYRESGVEHEGGWLTPDAIERAKGRVPRQMWLIEYELQEPSIEGRAIVLEAVERVFDPELGEFAGDVDEYIEIEKPDKTATYSTGVDWAKDVDWTIIATFRTDVRPWKCVAWERTGRHEWPIMVKKLENRLARFPPSVDDRKIPPLLTAAHDATGLGDVIDDYVDTEIDGARPDGVKLVGERRANIFSEYIAALESDDPLAVVYPRIKFAFNEHRYVTVDDLYGRGHPPDSVVAGALAWRTRSTNPTPAVAPRGAHGESKFRKSEPGRGLAG
jgi:hypothetical protein